MSKIRLLVLSLFTVFIVSAAATAAASASGPCETKAGAACLEFAEELTPSEEFVSKRDSGTKSVLKTAELRAIECEKAESTFTGDEESTGVVVVKTGNKVLWRLQKHHVHKM